jgi:hypothetical protein
MKKDDRTGLEAAHLLLDRGMRFTLTGAPFFVRLLGLHRFCIRPLRGGTIVEIFRLMKEYGLDRIETQEEANAVIDRIALVVATAILNDRAKLRWRKKVARLLLWKVQASELFRIHLVIVRLNSVSDFMNITGYFRLQTQMMMKTKFPGRTEKGS